MTGLASHSADRLLAELLRRELLLLDTPIGIVRFGMPHLWTEAEIDTLIPAWYLKMM